MNHRQLLQCEWLQGLPIHTDDLEKKRRCSRETLQKLEVHWQRYQGLAKKMAKSPMKELHGFFLADFLLQVLLMEEWLVWSLGLKLLTPGSSLH